MLFTPSARISLSSYTKTMNTLVLNTLENVKSRLHFWKYTQQEAPAGESEGGAWKYEGAEAGTGPDLCVTINPSAMQCSVILHKNA